MKKKLLAMTLASAMCVGMLAGCGGGSSASTDGGDSGSDDAYNISVIVKLTDGHFNKVMAGAKAYADEHDNVKVDILLMITHSITQRKLSSTSEKKLFSTDSDRNGMSMNMAVSMKKRLGYSSN